MGEDELMCYGMDRIQFWYGRNEANEFRWDLGVLRGNFSFNNRDKDAF